MPFITSELYEALGHEEQAGWAAWPQVDESLLDEAAERDFAQLQNAVTAVRNLRSEAGLSPGQTVPVTVAGAAAGGIKDNREVFEFLARAQLQEGLSGPSLSQLAEGLEIRLPLEGLIDMEAWRRRQEKRLKELRGNAEKSRKKLANAQFVDNAPAEVVEEERRRLAESEALVRGLKASLLQLG
jgi:valyl-tRNA synthetase